MALHIVLVEPEIPANTGNIARTCAATGTHLHLVRPLGFRTDDATLKRAGLDYWYAVHIEYHDSFQEVLDQYADSRFFYATTKADKCYSDFSFRDGDFLVFGKETKGLPPELIEANRETCMRMPMTDKVRSLNLSNSAAIIVYEALRQLDFPGLVK
ncbi:MAG: tRNA (uridine(34)/cytosine(34)/5-carboxymethylaminomethyluridine(34)-2'-O)-methyltransferase TrmL [Paenibacillus dendritiformis]|uniref:tRNA (uridine(34)/cytosine(34)/5- carboxymethylaminomethyluridine(34)-2'-O)- methyltransferase TrmL n=1 Tax=Paenibacillus dendritiformis TaxID=130049 RepID=UPI00143D4F75|nr:tRNA (uridine(34)/cytosine(34)/5-carboxymethylaminomethyluridine(34)-2'-O)-methyltransferase TrmL [Paenibacillus dendritiformis]MDU5145298.1 tRNA (uridine(34)/cytosine(34)/5-carboxymethylaminomethyluridine(34)-2'-O)-methyltransferase TrmL [Paenibacillus dendritiformis]NKI19973.1 tRNA (uridine(34)/cytosine(34)/5-carboxymethylaminomethyluridine(34)-2'-O)-methyltransferase TrmL [Paenibacillus dendritiformis]NRF99989.1 tRNA (uridine(34)/cytosine(34)/5-carboxymethylaminomethyluridine(34)-2'-O)-met